MGNENKHEDEQNQHGSSVLDVVVQLPSHPTKPQQTHHLQGTEETTDALCEGLWGWWKMVKDGGGWWRMMEDGEG